MTNLERITKYIAENGAKSILIHSMPKTSNWILAQKTEPDKWHLTLMNPTGNVTYNLGTVTDAQHLVLWNKLTTMEIYNRASQVVIARALRGEVAKFIKFEKALLKKLIEITHELRPHRSSKDPNRPCKKRRESRANGSSAHTRDLSRWG